MHGHHKVEVHHLLKNIRRKLYTLKTKKLLKLDYGDTIRLRSMLRDMDSCLNYLNHWQNAQCSIVLEACDITEPKHP